VERDAIARKQRRRQASDALEFERDRTASLQDQIDEIVTELEGPRVDGEAFARMEPEDAALARSVLHPDGPEGPEEAWLVYGDDAPGDEPPVGGDDAAEAEIERLEEEIAASHHRQKALERYLEALGS
jgi:hypothetical protein